MIVNCLYGKIECFSDCDSIRKLYMILEKNIIFFIEFIIKFIFIVKEVFFIKFVICVIIIL